MPSSVPEWLDGQVERIATRQRARVDSAKLVTTFVAGIASALVASAVQAGTHPEEWAVRATYLLGVMLIVTGAVVLLDRLEEPDHHQILQDAAIAVPAWSRERMLFELRRAALAAANKNEKVVTSVRRCMWLQMLLAVLTGVAAAYSMLRR